MGRLLEIAGELEDNWAVTSLHRTFPAKDRSKRRLRLRQIVEEFWCFFFKRYCIYTWLEKLIPFSVSLIRLGPNRRIQEREILIRKTQTFLKGCSYACNPSKRAIQTSSIPSLHREKEMQMDCCAVDSSAPLLLVSDVATPVKCQTYVRQGNPSNNFSSLPHEKRLQ